MRVLRITESEILSDLRDFIPLTLRKITLGFLLWRIIMIFFGCKLSYFFFRIYQKRGFMKLLHLLLSYDYLLSVWILLFNRFLLILISRESLRVYSLVLLLLLSSLLLKVFLMIDINPLDGGVYLFNYLVMLFQIIILLWGDLLNLSLIDLIRILFVEILWRVLGYSSPILKMRNLLLLLASTLDLWKVKFIRNMLLSVH